jgi:hypothetical protein
VRGWVGRPCLGEIVDVEGVVPGGGDEEMGLRVVGYAFYGFGVCGEGGL